MNERTDLDRQMSEVHELADAVYTGLLSADPAYDLWREVVRFSEEGNGPYFYQHLNDLWIQWHHAFTLPSGPAGEQPVAPVSSVLTAVIHIVAMRLRELAEGG